MGSQIGKDPLAPTRVFVSLSRDVRGPPVASPPAMGSQIQDQSSILPAADFKSCIPLKNPYVNLLVRRLVVNEAANIIHSPEDGTIRDCYGWDLMLDGEEDDSNFNQDLAMPDKLQGEISGDTQGMMNQQFG